MAKENTPPGGDSSPDLAAADRAAENLLRKGGDVTLAGIDPARESALDEAFAAVTPDSSDPAELGRENGGVKPQVPGTPDPKPTAEPDPEPAPEPKPEPKPAAPAPKPEAKPARKGLLDDVIDEPAAPAPETPEQAYDKIKLRSDASPKTVESFTAQRNLALQRESAVRAELEAATKAKLELEAKLTEFEKNKGALPEEVAKELKEHREYRALHDVSSRPEFKEKFDSKIDANYDSIYTLFKQEGFTDDKIAALKNMPETQRIQFIEGKVIPLLTDGQKRVVSAKIYENVNISEEKQKALDAARTDAEKILAEQREAPAKVRAQQDQEFAGVLRPKLQKLPFVYLKEIPSTATPAEKAELEAHNAFALELQDDIRRALAPETPEIRAEVISAVPIARYQSRQLKLVTARAEAAEAKLKAIAAAGNTGRLGKSAAAPVTPAAPQRGTDVAAVDAVDALFSEVSGGPRQ